MIFNINSNIINVIADTSLFVYIALRIVVVVNKIITEIGISDFDGSRAFA